MSELESSDAPAAPFAAPDPEFTAAVPEAAVAEATAAETTVLATDAEPAIPVRRGFRRKRALWTVTAVVAVLALVAVGIVVLIPGRTGNSVVAAVHCQPTNLATCLIKEPAGAVQLTSTDAWARQTAPGAKLYVSDITGDTQSLSSNTESLLTTDGLRKLLHNDWNAVDGNNVDLVLLQFDTQKGAKAWNSARAAEVLAAYPGQSVTIPGDSTGAAHAATKADAKGNVEAAYSAVVGNLVLNVAYSSPTQFSAQDLQTWVGTELASLRTAPPAPADPADVAPGTQQIACDRLGSCLMPMPDGAEHWSSPNDSNWISSSTLTPSQYIHLFWDNKQAAQAQVTANFRQDGVTSIIAHQDWDIDNTTEQADIYLLQTVTAAGANELASSNFGEPDWGSYGPADSYKIPNEPNARAWYTTHGDANGLVTVYYVATVGNVVVEGWLFFNGSVDTGTANSWAQSELNLVSRSVRTQPMGLFPLNAPAPPAAHQGSCPASGDCLLPPPAGTVDTTASSYTVAKDISALGYAVQYEPGWSSEVAAWLGSDGFKSAEHRSFGGADGVTADSVLMKFDKPAHTHAAAMLEYSLNALNDRDCTNSAVTDSVCLAEPVSTSDLLQNETVWVLAWKGDYVVSIAVTRSNAADLAYAYAWAQQQLDVLPAS